MNFSSPSWHTQNPLVVWKEEDKKRAGVVTYLNVLHKLGIIQVAKGR